MASPTIVLVPGGWFPSSIFDKLSAALTARGLKNIVVSLPTTTGSAEATFHDDTEAVDHAIDNEVIDGNDVVVVAHSYGGLPAHSAAKGLTVHSPEPSANAGHVIGFVLLSSGFTVQGQSFLDAVGGTAPAHWNVDEAAGLVGLDVDAGATFFNDLPADEAAAWAAKMGRQSLNALTKGGEHMYPAWKEAPNYYVVATKDQAIAEALQRGFVQTATEQGADVTVRELASGHAPMLSMPEETAAIIAEAARDFTSKKAM